MNCWHITNKRGFEALKSWWLNPTAAYYSSDVVVVPCNGIRDREARGMHYSPSLLTLSTSLQWLKTIKIVSFLILHQKYCLERFLCRFELDFDETFLGSFSRTMHNTQTVEKRVLLSTNRENCIFLSLFWKRISFVLRSRPSWWFNSWEVCVVLFSDGFRLGTSSDVDGMAKADFPLRLVDFKGWESMQRCRATLGQILQQRPWQSQERRKDILHLACDDQVLWTGLQFEFISEYSIECGTIC